MSHDTAQAVETIRKATAVGAVAFGALATFAPGVLQRMYGLPDPHAVSRFLGREWGSRTALFGALALAAPPGQARRSMALGSLALNSADTAIALTSSGLPWRTRVMGSATSAGFAAAAGYLVANEQ